jgi:glutathione synthase/RimK-type ligase-like ATP-grasp enzyme
MIPSIDKIKELANKINPNKPIVILTPVNRYLGFSAPITPLEQFTPIAKKWGVPLVFKDPQRILIHLNADGVPELYDASGPIKGSVYFPFGHDLLDRNMVRMIISAVEKQGAKVVNGSRALTVGDDKGLIAIELANRGIPCANSIISSARGDVPTALALLKNVDSELGHVVVKTTGFTAGGVGTQPINADIDYLAPLLWASRKDNNPKVIQNDIDGTPQSEGRTVVRAYIVGGEVVGCYTTKGYGIVNCAGLTRESKGEKYLPSESEVQMYINAAKAVNAEGFCRIDASGGKNKAVFEINPLARIDAKKYGLSIPEEILWYCIKLATSETK